MKIVATFEKVSYQEYEKALKDLSPDCSKEFIDASYDSIILPERATSGSAGYDFFMPYDVTLFPNEAVKIPTGIRCSMNEGWVLQIYPRSGHGFKFGIHLANTVGIIDRDYYLSDNEGHIFVKLVNDDFVLSKTVELKKGTAFCQGVFTEFGVVAHDNVNKTRNGGFGSTDK